MSIYHRPIPDRIGAAIKKLARREKLLLVACLAVFLISIAGLIWQVNATALIELPATGGELKEGIIGAPRFINPLLASSNADRDLAALVYSGLVRPGPEGELLPDLAERYTVSTDGKQYTFFLKPNLVWHDGEPVTAADVIFTVNLTKDPSLKSPRRAAWEGVEVERRNEREIVFTLKQPYSSFLSNATLGLLPAHLWEKEMAEAFPFNNLNVEPVGTGPYRVKSIKRGRDNLPLVYELAAFQSFALGHPKIEKLFFNFYPNEEARLTAFRQGEITSVSAVSPELVGDLLAGSKAKPALYTASLPRLFAVFFNQNQAKIFAQSEVREALNLLVDRQDIIDRVLAGYGQPAVGPVPTMSRPLPDKPASTTPSDQADAALVKHDWKKNPDSGLWEQTVKKETKTLSFTLSTADAPELKAAAELLRSVWEKFGAKVEIKIFEAGALNQNVIRPREYEALLFGEIVGREPDLYSFWHSSQRLDPGLNIALYTNTAVDKMLEELKASSPLEAKNDKLASVAAEIVKDTPAIFLYTPDFLYLLPPEVNGVALNSISAPADRFLNIYQWYLATEKVWPIFK
ncbi:MAG: hypothetical protein HYT47_01605 [Candidatus Vogelbacteria bacterium]|nr:hypothetical protein [Candidatus Vogelbacteria bacterium]